jgi:hypothetical protein
MAGCSGDTSACASKYNDVGYAAAPELSIEAIKTGNVTANQDLEVFIPQIPKLGRVLLDAAVLRPHTCYSYFLD